MKEATNYDLLDGGRKLPLVEDFYTIQGEGFHTGKPAYFIRLGGCDVGCRWCDAKYTWNPKLYPPTDISEVVRRATSCQAQAIVITGGEPLLYPLGPLTSALKGHGLKIFLETSGVAPFQRVFRLGLPFAQASAAASAGGVLAGARGEGHRRAGGRFAMGRAERRTGRTGVQSSSCSPNGACRRRSCPCWSSTSRRILRGIFRSRRINTCIFLKGFGRCS